MVPKQQIWGACIISNTYIGRGGRVKNIGLEGFEPTLLEWKSKVLTTRR